MATSNEYSGAALRSFILGLSDSKSIIDKLLAEAGVPDIDPAAWYEYEWAMQFFHKVEREIGRAALVEVGRKMIETAIYPPEIDSVAKLLPGLGYWFSLNARGPTVGTITCEFEDEHSATLDWSARGPCSICIGILEGACARYGVKPLIEHGEGCKDTGGPTCIYHVSW
jgi:hypothetical protein